MPEEDKKLYKDSFGFLPKPVSILFDCGKITPVENYDEVFSQVKEISHEKGYLYPRMMATYRTDSNTRDPASLEDSKWEQIPRTRRSSPIQHIPVSHNLLVDSKLSRSERMGIGGFLIQLTAFLYGVRTQFHDWRIDGRLPVKNRSGFIVLPGAEDRFFNNALKTWNGFSKGIQNRLTNILFVHAKAKSEEYEWLAFSLYYMVFDACFRILEKTSGVRAPSHEKRIKVVAEYFSMIQDQETFQKWVNLRNNLFHEAIWCGEAPGSNTHHNESNLLIFYFQNFTSRVLAGLLGHHTAFLTGLWKTINETGFE